MMESELCPHCRAIKELLNFANQQLQVSQTADDFDWWMRMIDVVTHVYDLCHNPCTTWEALFEELPESDGDARTDWIRELVMRLNYQVQREEQDYVERN